MSENRMQKLGKFLVHADGWTDVDDLRAAQEGCAVIRCEMLGYMRAYEVIAEHPEFDDVPIGVMIPDYSVVLETTCGVTRRRAFVRKTA